VGADRPGEGLQIERFQIADAQRDPRMFAILYEANFDRVYAFVARRASSRAEAEDLTSTVFEKALANLPRFEWRGVPFIAWLMRIAANELADRATPVPDLAVDIVADLDELDHQSVLFSCVRTLPEDQRRVLALRLAEQRSIRQVADELGRSVGAVKQLQFRALTTLRARMGDDDA
jgi:RNA polymerase sigma-70 factor (ECF subfamily)